MPRLLDNTFTRSLADTPKSYTGSDGFLVTVNGDGSGLVFIDPNTLGIGGIGTSISRVAFISEETGVVNVGTPLIGIVNRARLIVTSPFAANSSITLGPDFAPTDLADVADLDWTRVGNYEITTDKNYTNNTQIVADIVAGVGSPGTGMGIVIVEFVLGAAAGA